MRWVRPIGEIRGPSTFLVVGRSERRGKPGSKAAGTALMKEYAAPLTISRPVCRGYRLTGLLGIIYFLGKPTVWAPVILWSGLNFKASPNFGLSIETRNTVAKPSAAQYK